MQGTRAVFAEVELDVPDAVPGVRSVLRAVFRKPIDRAR